MVSTKALIWVSVFMVVSMEVLVTPLLSPGSLYQDKSASTPSTEGIQTKLVAQRFRKTGPALVTDDTSSARAVPTGPDPLHHHNHPTWP